jgi:hypothetical protein
MRAIKELFGDWTGRLVLSALVLAVIAGVLVGRQLERPLLGPAIGVASPKDLELSAATLEHTLAGGRGRWAGNIQTSTAARSRTGEISRGHDG